MLNSRSKPWVIKVMSVVSWVQTAIIFSVNAAEFLEKSISMSHPFAIKNEVISQFPWLFLFPTKFNTILLNLSCRWYFMLYGCLLLFVTAKYKNALLIWWGISIKLSLTNYMISIVLTSVWLELQFCNH